jgi:starch-binding outer membrane protein, SusD/RagB family
MKQLISLQGLFGVVLSAGLFFMVAGCVDLTENVVSGITADEHFNSLDGFEDAVIGAYQPLRHWIGGRDSGSGIDKLGNLGTDLYRDARLSEAWYNTYSAGLNPTSPAITYVWNHFYRGINNANTVINRADEINMSAELRQTRVAEARFLRAHYYYILVTHYGPVHLTSEETRGAETEANRTSEEEIWQLIIDDLEFAVQHLPNVQADWGRATRNAARHHLALAHLWLQNWEQAADYAISAIESGHNRLLDNFADVFHIDNQENDEIIWSVQFTTDQTANSPGNWQHLGHTMRYDQVPGMHRNLIDGRPFSRLMPTDYLMTEIFGNDYRPGGAHENRINIKNDSRYYATFREVYTYTDPGSIPEEYIAQGVSVGDTSIYVTTDPFVNYEWTEDDIAEKTYLVLRIEDWVTQWYPSGEKFRDPARAHFNEGSGTRDVFIMRLAETYLLAAEALLMDERPAEAVEYFNAVRIRAEAPGETIPLMTAAELNIDEILDERARELAGEGHRWATLKRTGTLLDRVRAHNTRRGDTATTAAENIQEHHLLRPIPQTQIDRTTNEYPQNPGY